MKYSAASIALLAPIVSAVSPIVNSGKDFVNSVSGERFTIIGVDYQPGGSSGFDGTADPLSDKDVCLRDAAIMQYLGVNTIRVYNLATSVSHNECASIFNAAGIYMILDVNSPLDGESINRVDPSSSYTLDYLKRVFSVVEEFKGYNNTLAFFSGNEVINEEAVSDVPNYIRAVTRDLRDYIAAQSDRAIPVGYSAADVRDLLVDTYTYLSCDTGNSDNSSIELFGLNSYSWCGESSYTTSGYDTLTAMFENATDPVFFSEYGCNDVTPRVFTEVGAIYGDEMNDVISGGLVYEYSQETSDYGLVVINSSDVITLRDDFINLYNEYLDIDTSAITASNSTSTSATAPSCSDFVATSNFTTSFDIPTRPSGAAALISNGVSGVTAGSFVSVSSTAEAATVYWPNGTEVTGLKLNALTWDESNLPGDNTSGGTSGGSSSTSTASGSSSSSTGTSGATDLKVGGAFVGFAAFVAGVLVL